MYGILQSNRFETRTYDGDRLTQDIILQIADENIFNFIVNSLPVADKSNPPAIYR